MHNICYHCRLVGQLACSIVVFNCLFVRVYSSRWCARSEGFWRKSGIWDGGEEGVSALCRIARFGIHRVATPILSTIMRKIKWSQLQNNLMFHFCHFHHLFTRGCSLFCLDTKYKLFLGCCCYMFSIIWLFRPCKLRFLKAYHPSTPTTLTTLTNNHLLL